MACRPYISGKKIPTLLCRENEGPSNSEENPMNTTVNQTKDNWDKFRERSKTKWHHSGLKGYVSNEFRSVEFTD